MERGARFPFLQHANNAQKRLNTKVWGALHFAGALPSSVALIFFAPECSHGAWRSFWAQRIRGLSGSGLSGSGLSGSGLSGSGVLNPVCLDAVAPEDKAFGFVSAQVFFSFPTEVLEGLESSGRLVGRIST